MTTIRILRRWTIPALAVLALNAASLPRQAPARYVIYLHGRIVEDAGRRPVSPEFGPYEYDAILDSFRAGGFAVLSEQRPPNASSEAFAARVVHQVDSLVRLGVPPDSITVVGFSKGGWIAILAASRSTHPVSFVLMGACGPWAFGRELHVGGRILSLYETSDSLGVSCAPMFANAKPGTVTREIAITLGLGHGAFFTPRKEWLSPALAWARREDPAS